MALRGPTAGQAVGESAARHLSLTGDSLLHCTDRGPGQPEGVRFRDETGSCPSTPSAIRSIPGDHRRRSAAFQENAGTAHGSRVHTASPMRPRSHPGAVGRPILVAEGDIEVVFPSGRDRARQVPPRHPIPRRPFPCATCWCRSSWRARTWFEPKGACIQAMSESSMDKIALKMPPTTRQALEDCIKEQLATSFPQLEVRDRVLLASVIAPHIDIFESEPIESEPSQGGAPDIPQRAFGVVLVQSYLGAARARRVSVRKIVLSLAGITGAVLSLAAAATMGPIGLLAASGFTISFVRSIDGATGSKFDTDAASVLLALHLHSVDGVIQDSRLPDIVRRERERLGLPELGEVRLQALLAVLESLRIVERMLDPLGWKIKEKIVIEA